MACLPVCCKRCLSNLEPHEVPAYLAGEDKECLVHGCGFVGGIQHLELQQNMVLVIKVELL